MRYKEYLKKTCPHCEKEFEVPPRNHKQQFCSITCCNKVKKYWLGKPRNQETKDKISKTKTGNSQSNSGSFKKGQTPWNKGIEYDKIKGEKHWKWNNGISGEHKQIRHSVEYNIWRKTVYARDNWTCQHCKVKQRFPVAHHIKTFKDYPELRFDVDNGITLCRSCHKKEHEEIGYKTRFNNKQLAT